MYQIYITIAIWKIHRANDRSTDRHIDDSRQNSRRRGETGRNNDSEAKGTIAITGNKGEREIGRKRKRIRTRPNSEAVEGGLQKRKEKAGKDRIEKERIQREKEKKAQADKDAKDRLLKHRQKQEKEQEEKEEKEKGERRKEAEKKNQELEKTRKDLEMETRSLKKEREKLREEIEQMAQELQEKANRETASGSQKEPPPKAPQKEKLTKAPPKNLDQNEREKPPEAVQIEESSSEESEACEKTKEGPIDVQQKEYATGAQIRMKNAIAEGKDTIERNRYIEKQRSSQTIKIICDPAILKKIFNDLAHESAKDVLFDMYRHEGTYYGTIIQYLDQ